MEITLKDVNVNNLENHLTHITLQLTASKIIGVYGEESTFLLEILGTLYQIEDGIITYDNLTLNHQTKEKIQNSIYYLTKEALDEIFLPTVEEQLIYALKKENKSLNNVIEKLLKILSLLDYHEEFLKRRINTLSSSEEKMLQFITMLLSDAKIILLDEPFMYLDYRYKRVLMKILREEAEQNKKLIVIASNDIDFIYTKTDEVILLKNHEVLCQGASYETLKKVELLEKNNIPIPNLVKFTYLAKTKKNAKLSYHKDIRDLIKDIYKHVEH